nr:sugar transferase [Chachezhania sediminis]
MPLWKRAFDLILASAFAVLLLPIFAGLVLWLWLTQGGPIFYVSERMKTPDTGFKLYKFRTMSTGTEDGGVSGGNKAGRITPAGRWLRATRLDEMPQLINILKGDLSFVGPRPPLRTYVDRAPELYAEVLACRPGVTGLATIAYHRHEAMLLARCTTAEETDAVYARACVPRKARLDLIYRAHRSPCYDIDLLLQTLGGMVRRKR